MKSAFLCWIGVALIASAGCTAILGDVEATGGATGTGGADQSSSPSSAVTSSSAGGSTGAGGSSSSGATCTDTMSDSKNCGACGHDCLGGTCQAGVCEPFVIVPAVSNGYIALDSKNVYYTTPKAIFSHSLYGGADEAPVNLVVSASAGDLHIFGSSMYWSDTLAKGVLSASTTTPNQNKGTVLYTSMSTFPGGVSVDSGGNIFFTITGDLNVNPPAGSLMTIPVGAGAMLIDPNLNQPYRIAVDDKNVYWTALDGMGTVFEGSKAGGAIHSIPANGNGGTIAIDADSVYWTSIALAGDTSASVRKVDKATFKATLTLAGNESNPGFLAVDDKYVYWTALMSCSDQSGAVRRADKTGAVSGATDVETGLNCPTGIAVNDVAIYWMSKAGITRLAK